MSIKPALLSGLAVLVTLAVVLAFVVKSKERETEAYEYLFV